MLPLRCLRMFHLPRVEVGVCHLSNKFSRQSISFRGAITHLVHTSARYDFKEDYKTTSLALFEKVKQVRQSPTPALVLGMSGLIPFVAAPVYMINSGVFLPDVAQAQLYYGASILSFLGGVRWGLTLPMGTTQPPNWSNLIYGITPSLIAWLGLLVSQPLGFLTVIGGLGFTGYMDLAMWGYPGWYKGMRFCLTFIAILSLWSSFMLKFVVSEAKDDKVVEIK